MLATWQLLDVSVNRKILNVVLKYSPRPVHVYLLFYTSLS